MSIRRVTALLMTLALAAGWWGTSALGAEEAQETQEAPEAAAPQAAPEAQAPEVMVVLRDFQVVLPKGTVGQRLVLPVGTTVRFVNEGPSYHNVRQSRPEEAYGGHYLFQSPDLAPGESWRYTFDQPGTYPILCDFGAHYLLGMTAEIEVTP
ncbi:cupredoxin domain-containing protein [Limnochorda pilosa]|uniref:Blue (type 1) copper domain-containing protein n=1 Tax=Limnochorda pilosa TaxID=1555112 RepID=A0A0K2SIT2_LIMPI|nr:plastocyanin/azurin family copper-binding protein [Limnochorda pilosa]BAS27018.1 hypothetical protein LIP_1161 [Limnochorda pilosa]